MKQIKIIFFIGLIYVCYQHILIAQQTELRLFKGVSGRVIQKESNLGVPNVQIEIINSIHKEVRFESLTDGEGYFKIIGNQKGDFDVNGIPNGSYSINDSAIQRSCPIGLVLDESSTLEIEVTPRKNIRDVSIYLRTGESVSGVILCPDGRNPMQNASAAIVPYQIGKNLKYLADKEGRFLIYGIKATNENTNFFLVVSSPGYANALELLKLKKGDHKNNLSITMGKGNISVKGKVVSADNMPIQGAEVSISSISRVSSELSDGSSKTEKNGFFRIIGFKNATKVEIRISHEIYGECRITRKIISGENRFIIKLGPQKGQISILEN